MRTATASPTSMPRASITSASPWARPSESLAVALDRGIRASVLNVMNGLQYEEFRLGTVFRPQLGVALANRIPRLFNNPSASCPGNGCAAFDENLPFRNQPPLTNDVAGAMEIQELLDRGEW